MNTLRIQRYVLQSLAAAITLAVAACGATGPSPLHGGAPEQGDASILQSGTIDDIAEAILCSNLKCTIDDKSWNHIGKRHCSGCVVGDKSAFEPAYCVDQPAAVSLCNAILNAPSCAAVKQANGNIAATATLSDNVGTLRTDCEETTKMGTVIFKVDGQSVVTQFPGVP